MRWKPAVAPSYAADCSSGLEFPACLAVCDRPGRVDARLRQWHTLPFTIARELIFNKQIRSVDRSTGADCLELRSNRTFAGLHMNSTMTLPRSFVVGSGIGRSGYVKNVRANSMNASASATFDARPSDTRTAPVLFPSMHSRKSSTVRCVSCSG
jgi:hypothetical protein